MASVAVGGRSLPRDSRFFLVSSVLMALVVVAGFSMQVATGRSTFASPVILHVHALLFFGWTTLFVVQNALADRQSMKIHRPLGWTAVALVPAMVVLGIYLTTMMVREGRAPFFFEPLYFLVMNALGILTFAALTIAAIVLRRRTDWHRRLMICGMAALIGPGFGRLLPMPLLIPWGGWAVFVAIMLFPIAGVIRDQRRNGHVHPAWWWGIGAIVLAQISMDVIADSPAGIALYEAITRGAPGAVLDPAAYPPFPGL